jgi:hypothetical protein
MATINKITRHFGWADHRLTSLFLATRLGARSGLEEFAQAAIFISPHNGAHHARFLFADVIAAASSYLLSGEMVTIKDLLSEIA